MKSGSARRLHRRQPVAGNQDLLRPLRQFQQRVAVVGSVAHLVANDPGRLLAMSRGGDCGKVHTAGWGGSRIPGTLLAAAATGRCSCGLAAAGPIGSPSTSHTDIVVSVRFNPGRTLVAGGWRKSVRLWDVATHLARAVLVQPIFEAVPRSELSGAGRSMVRKKAAGKRRPLRGRL